MSACISERLQLRRSKKKKIDHKKNQKSSVVRGWPLADADL